MAWTHPGHNDIGTSGQSDWADVAGTVSLADAAGDGVPTSGTYYISELEADHQAWLIWRMSINFYNTTSALWEEEDAIIFHNENNNAQAVDFWETASNGIQFGNATLSDINKPITYNDCYYMRDGLAYDGTDPDGRIWGATTSESGYCNLYGGVYETFSNMDNYGDIWYMPLDDIQIIGAWFLRHGGIAILDPSVRFQEVFVTASQKTGVVFALTDDTIGYSKVRLCGTIRSLNISRNTLTDFACREVEIRGSFQADTSIYNWGNYAPAGVQQGYLLDSDEIQTIYFESLIGYIGGDTSWLEERSSYNLRCENTSGTVQQDVTVRIYRKQRGTFAYDNWEDNFAEEFLGLTDVSGLIDEQMIVKRHYYPGYQPTRINYKNCEVVLRKYGFYYEVNPKVFGYGLTSGLNEIAVLKTNTFIDDTYSNVSAYTGFAIDFDTKKITISSSHTLQQLYDWLNYACAKEENIDLIDSLPLVTNDGNLFQLNMYWRIVNKEFISTGTKILELHNDDRIVPIQLSGLVERSTYRIETTTNLLFNGTIGENGIFLTSWYWSGSNTDIIITVRSQGLLPYRTNAQITNAGLLIDIAQIEDTIHKYIDGGIDQSNFRFRNDNGSETAATWKAAENIDITGQAKSTNFRLRFQGIEIEEKVQNCNFILQYRNVNKNYWRDV